MRLIIVQYGDYREAVYRFESGGEEDYYAQRSSVEFVASLTERCDKVTVVCVGTERHTDELLPNGVFAVGVPLWRGATVGDLVRVVDELNPTHVIFRSPITGLLKHAAQRGWNNLPLLADSFESRDLLSRVRHWKLKKVLNGPGFRWIGNHGVSSSVSLAKIGVNPDRIIPYDPDPPATPHDFEPKQGRESGEPTALFYAGVMSYDKGTGDVIDAAADLHARGHAVRLTLAGRDPTDTFKRHAAARGMEDHTSFIGRVSHGDVLRRMHDHDIVVVPSRPAYTEGIPFVIYDALVSRTPIVASNHPMFRCNLEHGVSALIYKAADAHALADSCERLMADPALYARLSLASESAWTALQMPARARDFVCRFLDGPEMHEEWARSVCLSVAHTERLEAERSG